MNGCNLTPAAELIRMIDPPRPPSMTCCAPAITEFQVPVTLTSMTSRNSSGVIAFQARGEVMPAFATMMSSRPRIPTPSSTALFSPSWSRVKSCLCRLHKVASDDQPLYLAGALVQPQQPDVAIDPLHRNLPHVAATAVHLNREIRDLVGHFGAEQFRRGRRDP